MLPLTPRGEICDIDGNCIDAAEDEIFKLTTVGGELAVRTLRQKGSFRIKSA